MGIFDKRLVFKPFEYPEVMKYVDAINHSYWLHTEWNFISDIQDFNVKLTETEKYIIKNTLLAIAQIEVSVKSFWGKIGDHFPKPEFNSVGASFSESEVRHERAYSHLLEVMGLNNDFNNLLDEQVIKDRVLYLNKYLSNSRSEDRKLYTLSLCLFTLFIENVSLFSQFAIIKSFNKYKNVLKDVDNVVQATQKEEQLHALFGIYVINKVKEEFPYWFDDNFYKQINIACLKAFSAECNIIKWIFREGELSFLSKEILIEFIKNRFNESIEMIGGKSLFEVDNNKIKELSWFNEEIYGLTHTDFFYKKSVNYSKKVKSITEDDLF